MTHQVPQSSNGCVLSSPDGIYTIYHCVLLQKIIIFSHFASKAERMNPLNKYTLSNSLPM
jgi:hypothetical protein